MNSLHQRYVVQKSKVPLSAQAAKSLESDLDPLRLEMKNLMASVDSLSRERHPEARNAMREVEDIERKLHELEDIVNESKRNTSNQQVQFIEQVGLGCFLLTLGFL